MKKELPPTDGLPIRARDLFAPRAVLAGTLAQLLSIPQPILTCSGTAALVVTLRALQRRTPTRTRVIVGAWSCPLVPLTASVCPGIEFVLCDLQANSLDLDPDMLARLCASSPPLAIIVTHLGGRISDIGAALRLGQQTGAVVIEDAAQALGAQINGESVGLQGDVAFYSLAFGKGLTSAEGGVLFSRHPELMQALKEEARASLPFSLRWEITRSVELLGYAALYNPVGLRFIYGHALRCALKKGDEVAAVGDDFTSADIPLHRLGRWRASVAASAARRLPAYWQAGRERALRRLAVLQQLPGVHVFSDGPGEQGVWPFFLLMMPSEKVRDAVMAHLWSAGVGVTRLFVRALPDYVPVASCISDSGPLPEARRLAARSLSVTNSLWLNDATFDLIVSCLREQLALNSIRDR